VAVQTCLKAEKSHRFQESYSHRISSAFEAWAGLLEVVQA
jgi:hypothetical protein